MSQFAFGQFALNLLAYLVPTFLLGFLWHLKWFHEQYRRLNIYRAEPIIPFGFASMLLQGCIFALVYPRLMSAPSSFADAALFAAGAAVLSWTFTTLAVAAKHPMTAIGPYVALESAFTAVQFALVAPLLAVTSRG